MPKFPRELEARFESETGTARCKRLWLEGLLAIAIFNVVLLVSQMSHPDPLTRAIVLKLYLVTPLALLVNVGMLFEPQKFLRESSVAFVAGVMGLALLFAGDNRNPLHAVLVQFGVAVILVFANSVMRLRFPFAVTVSAVLAMGEAAFLIHDRVQSSSGKVLALALTITTLLFSVIANYSHNREERLNFLFGLRGDLLIDALSKANKDLTVAAEQDSLTGLANRRAFDRKLDQVWKEAAETGSVVGIVLIDIDHFKRLNDSFGHLYGDKVLRRVARLLQETLRKKADYAARFGGEEFVILLPGTSLEPSLLVAERLRKLIELAGLPALETGSDLMQGASATVSCGVAAGSPLQFADIQQFLDAADKALYQAKSLGRNSVCASAGAGSLNGSAILALQ